MITICRVLFALLPVVLCGCGHDGSGEMQAPPPMLETFSAETGPIAVDAAGNIYVLTGRTIVKRSSTGALVATLQLPQTTEGPVPGSEVASVFGASIAVDPAGTAYVLMYHPDICGSHCFQLWDILKVAADGSHIVIRQAINDVGGLAFDPAGQLYITTGGIIAKVNADATLQTVGGTDTDPTDFAVDPGGNLYFNSSNFDVVRKCNFGGATVVIAGMGAVPGSADGDALMATFNAPSGVARDPLGNLYIADSGNALIRKLSPDGKVTTVAGTRGQSSFAAGPAPGDIDTPQHLAFFGGNLYFSTPTAIRVVRGLPQ